MRMGTIHPEKVDETQSKQLLLYSYTSIDMVRFGISEQLLFLHFVNCDRRNLLSFPVFWYINICEDIFETYRFENVSKFL